MTNTFQTMYLDLKYCICLIVFILFVFLLLRICGQGTLIQNIFRNYVSIYLVNSNR